MPVVDERPTVRLSAGGPARAVASPSLEPRPTAKSLMNSPVRLAFCITDLDPGGAERALVQIVKRLDRLRWEPRVINLSREGRLSGELRDLGIPCEDLGATTRRDPRVLWRLYRSLARFEPQLLQTFLFHANVAGRLAALAAGVPVVVSGIRVAERRTNGHLRWDRWTQGLVTHTVCVSEATARFSTLTGGLSPSKLSVIPNGVEVERFREVAPLSRSVLGVPEQAPLLVGIGRLDPQKGWSELLEQLPTVWKQVPETRLVIAGEGPLRDELTARIAQIDQRSRVRLIGYCDEIPALLQTATALVVPSRWEGMPNVVLEGMAAARPIVATAAEGVTELIEHDRHGLVVPLDAGSGLATALIHMLTHPDEAARMGLAAQDRALRQFTWERVTEAYDQLYRRLVTASVSSEAS